MEKFYNISDIQFDNEYMVIKVDDKLYKIMIKDVSSKLADASEQIRKDYKISPSGYGIHWRMLDEDLSINGLIRSSKK
jgi:hypothetical protein